MKESDNKKVKVRFIKAWGHPTRNEVYGPPQVVQVTAWAAERLVSGGFAERVEHEN